MSTTIHINTEPYEEVFRKADGERWCFVCRKRRVFDYVAKRPTDPMSWYGPYAQIECTVCKTVDGDCFPGREREWT
jgi:hypothetical protein